MSKEQKKNYENAKEKYWRVNLECHIQGTFSEHFGSQGSE